MPRATTRRTVFLNQLAEACQQCGLQPLNIDDFAEFYLENNLNTTVVKLGELPAAFQRYNQAIQQKPMQQGSNKSGLDHMIFPATKKGFIVHEKYPLTPNTKKILQEKLPPDTKLTPTKPIFSLAQGKTYDDSFSTSSFSVFRENTPDKKYRRIILGDPINKLKPAPLSFSFVITPDQILEDTKSKRHPSQNAIMSGMSAHQFLKQMNATIEDDCQIHWCHVRGLCIGGAQSKENLLPGTAGSNYFTLAYIEKPISHLLKKQGVSQITVEVQIQYHPDKPVPEAITYKMRWGNARFAEFSIDPLNPQRPTLNDLKMAKVIYEQTRTPPFVSIQAPSRNHNARRVLGLFDSKTVSNHPDSKNPTLLSNPG